MRDERWGIAIVTLLTVGFFVVFITYLVEHPGPPSHRAARVAKHKCHIKKLKGPNGDVFEMVDDIGNWWQYTVDSSPSTTARSTSYSLSSGASRVTLPPGSWTKMPTPPKEEAEQEQVEEEEEVTVEETAEAAPLSGEAEQAAEAAPEVDSAAADTASDSADVGDVGGGGEGGGGE